MRLRLLVLSAAALGVLCLAGGEALAQVPLGLGGSDGISVYGTGELSAKPNLVEIDLHVAGRAELTGDAIVKYRDGKKRLIEALTKLNQKGLSTDELSLSISAGTTAEAQQRMMNGMPQVPVKTQIDVTSTVRVQLKDVRDIPPEELLKTVGKLLDVAQDSGVTIGISAAEMQRNMRYGNYNAANTPVRFVVTDLSAMREKAYEAAVADARTRATRLAKLNQVKLGPALSVQEVLVAGENQNVNVSVNYPGGAVVQATSNNDSDEPRISSTALAGIPVQVKLLVRFAIQSPDPATAGK